MKTLVTLIAVLSLLGVYTSNGSLSNSDSERSPSMHLGHFSISLAVKDLAASRAFYEQLGFEVVFGEAEQNWLILQNGDSTIGLFQGMFERNVMTFNPGWDARAERFVLSIKSECLRRMIFFGEVSLRQAIQTYLHHYHTERTHQGIGNEVIQCRDRVTQGEVYCRERLGGFLKHYYRAA